MQAAVLIGFVGIGALGAPIAARLAEAGHALLAHDRRAAAAMPPGALVAASPREVADSAELVFGCVASPDDFRDVALGSQGLLHGRLLRVYVHLGTTGAPLVEELASALGARGVAVLDAPVTGGVPRAQAGTLTAMAAGPDDAFAAEPLMRCYASRIIRLGTRPGAAQVMKLLNNAVTLTNLAAACEAMTLGAKAGLAPADMLAVLTSGSAQSDAQTAKIRDHILTGRHGFGGSLRVVIKDLELYRETARAMGLSTAFAETTLGAYRRARDLGTSDDDMTHVIRSFEDEAGLTLRPAPGRHDAERNGEERR